MFNKKGVAGLELFTGIIVSVFMIGIILMVFQISGAKLYTASLDGNTGSVTNETLPDVDSSGFVDFAGVSGLANPVCTLGDVYGDNTTDFNLLTGAFYTQSGCSIEAVASVDQPIEDCVQMLTNDSSIFDGDCTQVYTGAYDCLPSGGDQCGLTPDLTNVSDGDSDTGYNLTSSAVRSEIYTTWILPNVVSVDDAQTVITYSINDSQDKIMETFSVPQGCINNGLTGFTVYVEANNDSTWQIRCNNATDFPVIKNGTYTQFWLYDEVMYWDVTDTLPSPYDGEAWKVSYSYVYNGGNTASQVVNDTKSALSTTTDYFPLFIVLGAMISIVLMLVIIVRAIKGSGMVGGEEGA